MKSKASVVTQQSNIDADHFSILSYLHSTNS